MSVRLSINCGTFSLPTPTTSCVIIIHTKNHASALTIGESNYRLEYLSISDASLSLNSRRVPTPSRYFSGISIKLSLCAAFYGSRFRSVCKVLFYNYPVLYVFFSRFKCHDTHLTLIEYQYRYRLLQYGIAGSFSPFEEKAYAKES